jgi:co-chaperonin GroES (HSP10)
MENDFKSKDIGATKAEIAAKAPNAGVSRSLARAKNLTANNDLDEIIPVGTRLLASLKAWPAQSIGGIFVPDSYTVIRGEQYVTEVVAVGPDVNLVGKGDAAIVSMYSGHHVTTKTGHAKILSDSDILLYRKAEDMKKQPTFNPQHWSPGINYILVEMIEKKAVKSEGGIIVERGDDDPFNTVDVATKSAVVIAIGPTNQYGTVHPDAVVGSTIVIDAHVGLNMNSERTQESEKYRIIFGADVLAVIKKK